MLAASSAEEHVRKAATYVPADDTVFVAHSGAGPLLPAVAAASGASPRGFVFVDAGIPPSGAAETALVEPEMVPWLASMAEDGLVPRWSEWWDATVLSALVPDARRRRELQDEMRALPLELFRSTVPLPERWDHAPIAYLRLSVAYDAAAETAREREWPVRELDGTHLDPATRPDDVADAIDALVREITHHHLP
jgi:hypothetical protein